MKSLLIILINLYCYHAFAEDTEFFWKKTPDPLNPQKTVDVLYIQRGYVNVNLVRYEDFAFAEKKMGDVEEEGKKFVAALNKLLLEETSIGKSSTIRSVLQKNPDYLFRWYRSIIPQTGIITRDIFSLQHAYARLLDAFSGVVEINCSENVGVDTSERLIRSDSATLNLYLAFQNSLRGVKKDLERYKQSGDNSKNPALFITDQDWEKGKEHVLHLIKDATNSFPNVQLNYSGHGDYVITSPSKNCTEYKVSSQASGSDKKTEEGVSRGSVPGFDPGSFGAGSAANIEIKCENPEEKKYFLVSGMGDRCVFRCSSDCKIPEKCNKNNEECFNQAKCPDKSKNDCQKDKNYSNKMNACASELKKCRAEFETKIIKGDSKCESSCKETCLDKYAISSEEMSEALKDKNVFGTVDACYAAGFTDDLRVKSKRIIATARKDETSSDSAMGGVITEYFDPYIKKNICLFDQNNDGKLTANEYIALHHDVVNEIRSHHRHTMSISESGTYHWNNLEVFSYDKNNCKSK